MKIFYHLKEVELKEEEQEHIEKKLSQLQKKFFSESVQFFVNLEKTRGDKKGDDLYEASIKIQDGPEHYFADERKDYIIKAFDHALRELMRIVRKERGKTRSFLRSAGRKIKQILRVKGK